MPVTGSKIILAVSVGNSAFEDGSLRVLLFYAREAKSVEIILGCTLQRHNLEIEGIETSVALSQSAKAGDEWLSRNDAAIKGILETAYVGTAHRWGEWLNTPQYHEAREEFDRLCDKSAVIAASVTAYLSKLDSNLFPESSWEQAMFSSIAQRLHSYAERWKVVISIDRLKEVVEKCYEYLAEETVIIYKLWPSTFSDYTHILYPSRITPILEKGYNEFIVKRGIPQILQWECANVKLGRKIDRRTGSGVYEGRFFPAPPFELSEKDCEAMYGLLAKFAGYLASQPSGKRDKLQLYLLQIFALSPHEVLSRAALGSKKTPEEDGTIMGSSPHSPPTGTNL